MISNIRGCPLGALNPLADVRVCPETLVHLEMFSLGKRKKTSRDLCHLSAQFDVNARLNDGRTGSAPKLVPRSHHYIYIRTLLSFLFALLHTIRATERIRSL